MTRARAKKGKPMRLPLSLSPQLATLVEEPPAGGQWIYEVKFDGYRILARIERGDVRLFTRNGNNWTPRLTHLAEELACLGIDSAWLDGEIVVPDAKGNPSFQLLQNAFDSSKTRDIVYYVFDIPYFEGRDLRRLPVAERRAILAKVFEPIDSPHLRFSEHFEADADSLLASACKRGLEGLIGKRADAGYTSGRSAAWIKLKCTRRQEFVVVGYTDPKGSRAGFGSLLLAVHERDGKLRYAGNVGTGFDDASLRTLKAKLASLETPNPPLAERPKGVKAHWVRPKLVAEVSFGEWTSDGRVRHPVFQGLRSDKDPDVIKREKPVGNVAGVRVSHGERRIDAASGATKLDLVRYYDSVAEWMLPHLLRRPVSFVRAPAGVEGKHFFQRHSDPVSVPGVKELAAKFWPDHPPLLEVGTREALVAAAQMNVIEFHTWNSTTKAIAKPDRMLFDLDPGDGIEWAQLIEGAMLVRKLLEMLGLESFVKTSGGKGLHIVVPLTPKDDYETVKDFSRAVVAHLAETIPKLFVVKSGASNRVGRIFPDYLRNGESATTAAAFSARARPGLGVSVPLRWSELAKVERADQWNILSLHERLAKLRGDPWKDYWTTKQTIAKAAKKLTSRR